MFKLIFKLLFVIIVAYFLSRTPSFQGFSASIVNVFNEKTGNVTREVDRILGKVDSAVKKVNDTKERVEDITKKIGEAKDSVENALGSAQEAIGAINKVTGKEDKEKPTPVEG